MKNKIASGIIGIVAISGGVDASILNEQPIPLTEISLKEEVVTLEQKGNVIESQLPWKDQVGFKVKYDLGEPTVAERFTDKRSKQVITETVDIGDGGFKIDVLLNEKPNTNTFCYTIEGAENYDFFYQPPLTAEEIAEGSSRPENIVGSYAVYHKTLRNNIIGRANYATGKVMHIPRPQVWEMGNDTVKHWADLSYQNGQLCVTAPQEFLDTATYPVRVDPTFGYTSAGATPHTMGDQFDFVGEISGASFSLTENGSVTKLTGFYTDPTTSLSADFGSGTVYGAVYDTSFNRQGSLGGPTTVNVGIVTPTAVDISYTTGMLSAGDYYIFNMSTNPNFIGVRMYYDAGGTSRTGNGSYDAATNRTDDPLTSGSLTSSTRKYSVYATYEVSLPASTPTATINGAVLNGARI